MKPLRKSFAQQAAAGLVCSLAVACAMPWALAEDTVWNFDDPFDPFAPAQGIGFMEYWDPDLTAWGPGLTAFGKASQFGLPLMPGGGDPDVMKFPACTPRQGYVVFPQTPPNGVYGDQGKVSNYTFIMDVLYPTESDGQWRPFWQADPNNADDAEAYAQNTPSGGIGILGQYHGSLPPNSWHRVAFVVRAAPGEGQMHKYIDGTFVGGQGTTGSGLELRFALDPSLLLFTDDNGETAPGYVASIYFVGRNMSMEEVKALGGPNAAGANVPGPPAAPIPFELNRIARPIGHRGNSCCAPENTLASIAQAFSNHAVAVELDARVTADGVAVLMHDATVDRTTDGTGDVASMTLAELKTLDAGSWFGAEYAGERVPTVAEAMQLIKGKGICYLDLKVTGMALPLVNAVLDADFPQTNLWLWVNQNEAEAAELRSWLPDAGIVYGAPPAGWENDPTFFQRMRDLGVVMFDIGSGGGNIDPVFAARAKQEGFLVAVYTILSPPAMVNAAANGVDLMETDFPGILHEITPLPGEGASRPNPPDGATNQPTQLVLSWLVASNALSHRIYFGTNNPPPLVGEQSSDLFLTEELHRGTRYYWRVDEITPSGTVTGAVWSFETLGRPGMDRPRYEWTFDAGDLEPALGHGVMRYADGAATEALTQFGVTDGQTVPHINNVPARYMHVPAFTDPANGYHVEFLDSGPNGGGQYINQFTVLFDVYIPGPLDWTPFFNTNPNNGNDADFYVAPDGRLGIGALGYTEPGTIQPDTWYRIGFAADLQAGLVKYYLNGELVHTRTGGALTDGRFSLYSILDGLPSFLLFNEGDTSGVYTHELYVNSFAFTDWMMSDDDMAALGGPNAVGIFVNHLPPLSISVSEGMVRLSWPGSPAIRLQKTSSLSPANWQDVPGTAGLDTYAEPISGQTTFYRLIQE